MADENVKIDDQTVKLYIGGISPSWNSDYLKGILGNFEDSDIKRVDIVNNYAFAVCNLLFITILFLITFTFSFICIIFD